MPDITLFFLQASRAIRTAWLLEELGLDYKLEFANRIKNKAPADFKARCGNPLGKLPSLVDGGLCVYESGAITEYLCEMYDNGHRLLPQSQPERSRAQIWIAAAEGAFMLHGLAITYARWNFPKQVAEANPGALEQMEDGLSANVRNDFDWLEDELSKSQGKFLLGGDHPTAADIMMQFSVDFILESKLGIKDGGRGWPKIQLWMEACRATETYKRAVQKSGYTLHPDQM